MSESQTHVFARKGGDEGSLHQTMSHVSLSSQAASSAVDLQVDLDSDAPILTVKGVLAGVISGSICTLLALYYGLKVGITPSLNILGGVLGFAITKALMKTGLFGKVFTPQENAVIQTVSVATYAVACPAFGFASGFLAMNQRSCLAVGMEDDCSLENPNVIELTYVKCLIWALSLFSYGFFIAYPLRNYFVVKKRLAFPSGVATAYVITAMHADKKIAKRGVSIVLKFFSLAFFVSMFTWFFEGLGEFPIFGSRAADFGWVLDWDLGSFGIGILLSMQVNASMVFGAIIIYAVVQPFITNHKMENIPGMDGVCEDDSNWVCSPKSSYVGLYAYGLFAGLAVMIVNGVWSIAEIIITVIKGYRSKVEAVIEDEVTKKRDAIFNAKGFPLWGSIVGYAICGSATILIHHFLFEVQWWMTLIAIVIIPALAISNIEGMGRTDWDVASSYGKLVMFPFGLATDNVVPLLALCHTTVSGCSNSAVLMQDFKTGYLLGAPPSTMFYAQIIGTVFGCFICPGIFKALTTAWPLPLLENESGLVTGLYGPIFRTLAIVAKGEGFDVLPKNTLWFALGSIILAVVLNVALLVCGKYAPRAAKWIPEPSAMSIGMLVGAAVPLEFFIGGLICYIWARKRPTECNESRNYIASGCIAGSGFAIVAQVIISLLSLDSPIVMGFAANPSAVWGTKQVVTLSILLCIVALVCWMGAKFWFLDEETADIADDSSSEEGLYADFGHNENGLVSQLSATDAMRGSRSAHYVVVDKGVLEK